MLRVNNVVMSLTKLPFIRDYFERDSNKLQHFNEKDYLSVIYSPLTTWGSVRMFGLGLFKATVSLFALSNDRSLLYKRRFFLQRIICHVALDFSDSEVATGTKYSEMLDWLKSQENAIVSDKLEIKPSKLQGGGYGAFVTQAVDENELLFRIPRAACITLSDALSDERYGESFRKLVEKAGPGGNTVVLAGYIAKERLQSLDSEENLSIDSKYGPYLATLPWERFVNNQEHILYWSGEEVESLLRGSMCYGEAVDLRREVALAIKVLSAIISPPAPKFVLPWQKDDSPKQPLDGLPEAVRAAFVCLLTRAFQDDGNDKSNDEEKLVPLLDMLQHSEEPNVSHVMLKENSYSVELRARRSLEAGEELLNQYRSEQEENMPYHRVSANVHHK
jgi:SET domain